MDVEKQGPKPRRRGRGATLLAGLALGAEPDRQASVGRVGVEIGAQAAVIIGPGAADLDPEAFLAVAFAEGEDVMRRGLAHVYDPCLSFGSSTSGDPAPWIAGAKARTLNPNPVGLPSGAAAAAKRAGRRSPCVDDGFSGIDLRGPAAAPHCPRTAARDVPCLQLVRRTILRMKSVFSGVAFGSGSTGCARRATI